MTQEEKAKAYDKAREKIAVRFGTNVAEEIFSEFEESEDERIRKELLEHCKNQAEIYIQTGNKCPQIQSWIDWLEKQGEQKQYDIDVLEKHITKDSISELAHTVIVRNGWEIVDAKEQNPVWSEEDETGLTNTIIMLKEGASLHFNKKDITKAVNWIKSLKQKIKEE